jgi:hypothetical protein
MIVCGNCGRVLFQPPAGTPPPELPPGRVKEEIETGENLPMPNETLMKIWAKHSARQDDHICTQDALIRKFKLGSQTRKENRKRRNELVSQAFGVGITEPIEIWEFIRKENGDLLKGKNGKDMTPESVILQYRRSMKKN